MQRVHCQCTGDNCHQQWTLTCSCGLQWQRQTNDQSNNHKKYLHHTTTLQQAPFISCKMLAVHCILHVPYRRFTNHVCTGVPLAQPRLASSVMLLASQMSHQLQLSSTEWCQAAMTTLYYQIFPRALAQRKYDNWGNKFQHDVNQGKINLTAAWNKHSTFDLLSLSLMSTGILVHTM